MSKASDKLRLKEAIQQTGHAWLFRFWGKEEDRNLENFRSGLARFIREYERRFGERPDPYKLLEVNPGKGAAFFHADTLAASAEMKILVWRILFGWEIAQVEFKYKAGKPFSLKVIIRPPYGQGEEAYTSQHFADFRVLRHFGISGVDDQLYLFGYYVLSRA